ncbi:MAG TPA: DUF3309 domain-containing protein [Blastocatellia bacterium]|nr:DUF3309 domain-containing protein [Blastocatellia bacterium]
MGILLVLLLLILLIGMMPSWPYSRNWGYYPSGLIGLVFMLVLILAVSGRL